MENKKLKEKFVDERTEIEYRLVGDYYIPNITIPKARRTGNIRRHYYFSSHLSWKDFCFYIMLVKIC